MLTYALEINVAQVKMLLVDIDKNIEMKEESLNQKLRLNWCYVTLSASMTNYLRLNELH